MSDFPQQVAIKVAELVAQHDENLSAGLVRESPPRTLTFTDGELIWYFRKLMLGHASTGLIEEYFFRVYKKPLGRCKKIQWQMDGYIYKKDKNFTKLDPSLPHAKLRWANDLVIQYDTMRASEW